MIEPIHDLFDLLIAHLVTIRSLRKVLAYQTMGIFIDAPLPKGVGMSKIDIGAKPFCNDLMPGKRQPVIQGDRQDFCFQRLPAPYSRFRQKRRWFAFALASWLCRILARAPQKTRYIIRAACAMLWPVF